MDLTSGYPFWPAKNGFLKTYEPLDRSLACEVLVLGGGITGACIARSLVEDGRDVVVLDRRNFGWGSTCGSTALLMYEIDTHLRDLIRETGQGLAVAAYRSGLEAIEKVEGLCRTLGAGEFRRRDSVYFASTVADGEILQDEFETRREFGLPVEWISSEDFSRQFDFPAPGAIRSRVAAEIDAFQLTHALLADGERRGARLFARTEATECHEREDRLLVKTDRGPEICCGHVVVACGFESLKYLRRSVPVRLTSSFALASEPIRDFAGWPDRCLLWESARPYCYARTTSDGRGLLGGEDVPFQNALARDALLPAKVERLERRWRALFPRIPLELAFPWTGTFAETGDGLPYIGFPSEQPRAFFALCYGGNGITYSVLAAEMLRAALRSERHPYADVYSFDRKKA